MKTRRIDPWWPSIKKTLRRVARAMAVLTVCLTVGGALVWWGQGVFLLQKRAQAGEVTAQYLFGRRCFTRPSSREELLSGVEWMRKAAQAGHVQAQTTLGIVYARGIGVEQSPDIALYWLKRAAQQGDPLAQNELATAYATGRGVSRDLKKAIHWYSQAASSGAQAAARNLALVVASQSKTLGDIATRSGKHYPNASLRKVEPDGITVAFQAQGGVGFAKVKAQDLPANLAPLCGQATGRSYAASGFNWSQFELSSREL